MGKSIIVEGKTSTEAIEKGLKELKVSREKVDIKVLENEEKRSFFSILTPRVVKVEMTLKDNSVVENNEKTKQYEGRKENYKEKEKVLLSEKDIKKIEENLEGFLKVFTSNLNNVNYSINSDEQYVYITLTGGDSGKLIGYRGDTLNSLQTILTAIANKQIENKAHIILDIEGYREKRKVALEELADKITRTVINTGRQITLEPMSAYERKIIHNRLQDSKRVRTYSVGEEPYRKVVVTKK